MVLTNLQAPALVMKVMKPCPITVDIGKRVPGENIAAMVADGFPGGKRREKHTLADSHSRNIVR